MNRVSPNELDRLEAVFKATIDKINAAVGNRAFRIIRALNAAAFDAVMVGLAIRLERHPEPNDNAVLAAYEKLIAQDDFRQVCERATAVEENVKTRLHLSTAAFADI